MRANSSPRRWRACEKVAPANSAQRCGTASRVLAHRRGRQIGIERGALRSVYPRSLIVSLLRDRAPTESGTERKVLGTPIRSRRTLVGLERCNNVGRQFHGRNKYHLQGVPAIAASMRLRVGLGGADTEWSGLSSCSGSRVFPCLITFGGSFASSAVPAIDPL